MAHGNHLETSQEDVARKRQKYQLTFEQSRDALMFHDGERFQDCNPATLAMFRVPDVATFVTLHPAELSPPYQPDGRSSRKAAADRFDEALSQGQAFFEWRHRTWDGVDFPTEVLLNRVDLEEGPLVQALVRDISDRKEAEAALRSREQELAEAQRLAHLGSWVSDFGTNEIRWSDEVYRIFGLNRGERGASHESFMAAVHPDDRAKVQAALETSFKGEPYEVDHRVMRPDGEVRTVLERGYTELDADGKPLRMFGTAQDITEQRRLEDSLRRFAAILDSTPDIVTMHDGDGTMLYLNATGRRFVGLPERSSRDLWQPKTGWDRSDLPPETESLEGTVRRAHPPWAAEKILNEGLPTARKEGFWQGETVLLDSKGKEVPVSQVLIVHRDDAGDTGQISTIIRDISKQKHLEALLEREATTDHLTGLHNRQRFDAEMERALARHARYGTDTALAMIDLDHFKRVNDTYGHDVGDQVLVELTVRLVGEMREPDFLARWGGEEFVALLPETGPSEAARVAERLRRRIEIEPFPEVGALTISLGITNFRNGDTPNTLLKRVDTALYEAKRAGRNRVAVNGEEPGA